ncbi:protein DETOXIFICATION 12-like [Ziziphus jujuba]|uniref:Protein DETOXIFICATION n=1 Tax=Ziziphus jujuba TaxID=326968 RepID=A0ABM3I557_ZIZJJ|nr:protein DETOXIFICATION 12-like [Ziziphus jujuba]
MEEKWSRVFGKELKKVSFMAAPMVALMVLQYLYYFVAIIMVGHLGELSLSGVSMANSFTSVTGFCFLLGLTSGLETLCGQAYGAEQYQKLGIYTYTSIISLTLVCLPISILWIFTDKILILIGQDPSISEEAQKFSIYLIPNLFFYAILQSFIRYLQTQSLILPMLYSYLASFCLHIPLCWILIFKLKLEVIGAALAINMSSFVNVILLGFYIKYSSACEKARPVFSMEVFSTIKEFFSFGIPSALMICLEWWAYEIIIFLSGLLPNPKLETSVLSICFSITYFHAFIPFGLGTVASIRVSNELGAGNPKAAKVAVLAVMFIATVEIIIVSTTIFFCRHILGNVYSNEKEVVDHVADMGFLLSLSIILDGLQIGLSGVARGTGWQHLGAYVNLSAFYLVGTPFAAVLAFVLHLKGKGLWIGLVTGSTVQVVLLSLITSLTNWHKQASKARERIFDGDIRDTS